VSIALDMNAYRIKKNHRFLYGSDEWPRRHYFYGGIGENSSYIRKLCTDMEYFGMELMKPRMK
jgi:acetate kinase